MCVEVHLTDELANADGAIDMVHRRLVLADRLSPVERTTVARALLSRAGIDQPDPTGQTIRCICGHVLTVDHPQTKAG